VSRPAPLDDATVDNAIAALRWRREGSQLVFEETLPSFAAALGFVVSVGALAEAADHHPDIDLRFRTVRLVLTTHDAGALTELDLALARGIDAL